MIQGIEVRQDVALAPEEVQWPATRTAVAGGQAFRDIWRAGALNEALFVQDVDFPFDGPPASA